MFSLSSEQHASETVAYRKLAAAEMRRARKAARDPRNRLLSDSSNELPKGILKNAHLPTKRSASECVDDLSQIMADLNLNISDLPKASGRFCPIHQLFQEEEEDEDEEDNESDDDDDDDNDGDEHDHDDSDGEEEGQGDSLEDKEHRTNNTDHHDHKEKRAGPRARSKSDSSVELHRDYRGGDCKNNENTEGSDRAVENRVKNGNRKTCDCNLKYGDRNNEEERPKKSVRFDEHVYETVFFAARLYDRRNFAKYHLSTRHHPPSASKQGKTKKNKHQNLSKASKGSNSEDIAGHKSETGYKQTKSQRDKQSKKDRKKRLARKDVIVDTSGDDQGYCSAFQSFSD